MLHLTTEFLLKEGAVERHPDWMERSESLQGIMKGFKGKVFSYSGEDFPLLAMVRMVDNIPSIIFKENSGELLRMDVIALEMAGMETTCHELYHIKEMRKGIFVYTKDNHFHYDGNDYGEEMEFMAKMDLSMYTRWPWERGAHIAGFQGLKEFLSIQNDRYFDRFKRLFMEMDDEGYLDMVQKDVNRKMNVR